MTSSTTPLVVPTAYGYSYLDTVLHARAQNTEVVFNTFSRLLYAGRLAAPGGGGGKGGGGDFGGERAGGGINGGDARHGRGPQSTQSVPYEQCEYSEPGPPSLQVLSIAYMHVFKQTGGATGGAGGDGGGLGGAGGDGGGEGGN